MKEVKSTAVQLRITFEEKAAIKEYAESHNMTMSEFIRSTCMRIIDQNKEEN